MQATALRRRATDDSSGDTSLPPGAPKTPDRWAGGSGLPFFTVVPPTWKDGTRGRYW